MNEWMDGWTDGELTNGTNKPERINKLMDQRMDELVDLWTDLFKCVEDVLFLLSDFEILPTIENINTSTLSNHPALESSQSFGIFRNKL